MPRPIFIVGLPRSGSTVFYNTLARHPDVAWISQASKKFPRSLFLTKLFMRIRRDRRPTEGHRIWRKFVRAEDDVLGREHVTDRHRRYYRTLVAMHAKLTGRPRFLSKYPRNVLRMPWLDEIFPDALFLHLIRDGRAVSRSALEMRDGHGGREAFWGIRPPGWRELAERDPIEAVALQWRVTIEHARRAATSLGDGRYFEVRYEDFCREPVPLLRGIGEWAGLDWSNGRAESAAIDIQSRNYKWREGLKPAEIDALERLIGPLLAELGYDRSA